MSDNYWGGAKAYNLYDCYNFNSETGEEIELSDVVKDTDSFVEAFKSSFKNKYGSLKDPRQFLDNVKENGGVDGLRNFIIDTVKPYIEKIIAQEKLTGISMDYNDILRGLISSCIVELQLQQLTKDKSK